MRLPPRPRSVVGSRHQDDFGLAGVQEQKVGIPADFVGGGGQVFPGVAPIGCDVYAVPSGNVNSVRIGWVDDGPVYIVIHSGNSCEGLPSVCTPLQTSHLHPDKKGVGVFRMEVNVLSMSDVGRARERPIRRVDRPEGR